MEDETLHAPALLKTHEVKHDNFEKQDDQTTCSLAKENPGITAAGDCEAPSSGGSSTPPLTPSDLESSSPPSSSLPQPERFDFIPPRQVQSTTLSKTQKRKLERKRAAAKKAEAAELMRRMEKKATQSPEQ